MTAVDASLIVCLKRRTWYLTAEGTSCPQKCPNELWNGHRGFRWNVRGSAGVISRHRLQEVPQVTTRPGLQADPFELKYHGRWLVLGARLYKGPLGLVPCRRDLFRRAASCSPSTGRFTERARRGILRSRGFSISLTGDAPMVDARPSHSGFCGTAASTTLAAATSDVAVAAVAAAAAPLHYHCHL